MSFAPRWSLPTLLAAALWACPASARAQDQDDPSARDDGRAIEPAAPHALGRVLTAGPTETGPTLLLSGGYGYTESVLGTGDKHHRIAGALALDERPLPWLGLALHLDGRYDVHVAPGLATDTGLVGDPRLYARVDHAWDGGFRVGARAGLWLPGRNAPSLDVGALSPELVAMVSYAPASAPIALTANVGYRLDRSAHSAPDAAMLSASDRLALEVSAFDEVLAGFAATIGRGPAQAFVEGSAQLLVGSGAPGAGSSPILVGAGGRFALGRNLRLEAEAEVSPSRRPDTSPSAALVPIPPRFAAWVGLTCRFGAAPESSQPGPAPTQAPAPVRPAPVAAPPPAPEPVELAGHVAASDGGKLVDLRLEVTVGDAQRDVTADADGRFRVEGKPGDAVTVTAEAARCEKAQATTTLAASKPNELEVTLARLPPKGQIRGLVRSLRGAAVAADVAVEPDGAGAPGEPRQLRAQAGRFEVDVAPGRYRVTISAHGYEAQKRTVDVEENGVTVLNVDLRKQ